ncbi:MAG: PilZ domain-containing protein [Terracidiphilus sp.]
MPLSSNAREPLILLPKGSTGAAVPAPAIPPQQAESGCAYNLTRGRFLSTGVDSADFPVPALSARLPLITPGSNTGLRMIPFRGISPMNVQVPVDLIYLDHDCNVLDVVELFPVSIASASRVPAASVLAVPAHTISTTETCRGDRLTFCSSTEIAEQLLRNAESETATKAIQDAAPDDGLSTPRQPGKVLPWLSPSTPAFIEEKPLSVIPPATPVPPSVADPAPHAPKPAKASKSWLQRLLNPDPPEPRKTLRVASPSLTAHFFTGGPPKAHGVRDISPTGVFLLTEERWYLGTLIGITLTDSQLKGPERFITVTAKAVRWGNDGVGLEFVFAKENGGVKGTATKREMEYFLQRDRTAAN